MIVPVDITFFKKEKRKHSGKKRHKNLPLSLIKSQTAA